MRQYHVQFYGDECERGWVPETASIDFEGVEAFDEFCRRMVKEHGKDKKNYQVVPNRRAAWDIAVEHAEQAYQLTGQQRIEQFALVQELPSGGSGAGRDIAKTAGEVPSNGGGTKRSKLAKHEPKQMSGTVVETIESKGSDGPPKKRHKMEESPSTVALNKDSAAATSPPASASTWNVTNKFIVQFTVFCQKRRDSVKREHPEFDDRLIDSCLQLQWAELDDETRSRFIPMGQDFAHLSQMVKETSFPEGRCSSLYLWYQREKE